MEKFDSYDRKFSPLIGEPLRSVEAIEDGAALRFTLLDGSTLTYDAVGDCCSTSWIEHISIPDGVAGFNIYDISEPELPPHPATDGSAVDNDETKVYHTAFATGVGHILVEYRNTSNGYYGGYLTGPREGSK